MVLALASWGLPKPDFARSAQEVDPAFRARLSLPTSEPLNDFRDMGDGMNNARQQSKRRLRE